MLTFCYSVFRSCVLDSIILLAHANAIGSILTTRLVLNFAMGASPTSFHEDVFFSLRRKKIRRHENESKKGER